MSPVLRVVKTRLRRLVYGAADALHHVANNGQSALPPPGLRTVGGGDFHAVGAGNVLNLKRLTDIDGKTVLEIGCGVGRNALALTTYRIQYHGIDIYKPYIDWCTAHITRDFPAFSFSHADVRNGAYNPAGNVRSEEFLFPFPSGHFDLILLTSVFTHMMEREVMHYLDEIARLLKPGGGVYATFFLLDDIANHCIQAGRSHQAMKPFDGERVMVVNRDIPEDAVAFSEPVIVEAMASRGLRIEALHHGSWCGRPHGFDYQDVIFAKRSA